ncbi:MAG: universal stress protein [Cellvibrionaceae bacterium]
MGKVVALESRAIETIIFATDLGMFHNQTLSHAIELAHSCDGKVVVIHAVEPFGVLANAMVTSYLSDASRKDMSEKGVERVLRNVKNHIVDSLADDYIDGGTGKLDCIVDVRVKVGKPAEVILDEANNENASVIVMGSHGTDSLESSVLGTVTQKVLQMAKMPVFMVPLMNPARRSQPNANRQMKLW